MPVNRNLLWIIGALGLALTLLPSIFVFLGSLPPSQNKLLMAIGMVLWFVAAPSLTSSSGEGKKE